MNSLVVTFLLLVQCIIAAEHGGDDLRREVGGSTLGEVGLEKINNGRTRYRGTEGALTMNDCLAVRAMAESVCAPQGGAMRYAEVGSYLGLSATLVADACPQALIFAHDVFPMSGSDGALDPGTHPPPGTEKLLLRFWTNVARNGLEGRVVPMRGFSQETLPVHADASLDMAFVDGDHSYATTMADLRQIWAKVRPGGLLLLHDAVLLDDGVTDHEVRAAAKAFAAEAGVTFYDIEHTWGMVAFPKPSQL